MAYGHLRRAVHLADAALQPNLSTLWHVSTFQRMAYQSSFSAGSARSWTGRLVRHFQSIRARSLGCLFAWARMVVNVRAGYGFCFCLPIGGSTVMQVWRRWSLVQVSEAFCLQASTRFSLRDRRRR